MKVKTLSALAGVGTALIVSSHANATYVGLTVVKHTSLALQGVQRDVYRVYAMFSDPNDFLTAIAGSPTFGNLVIESRNSTNTAAGSNFFNSGGGNTAPTQSLINNVPNAQWDTFATIGVAINTGSDATATSPSFPTYINGASLNTNNAGWFVTGATPQGQAGNGIQNVGGTGNWGVLMTQLTVNAGNHVRGSVNVAGINNNPLAGGTAFQTNGNGPNGPETFNSFPAPGAMALIGLAGLIGASRRRRG